MAVDAGRVRDPPVDSVVPQWVRRVVLRGLAREPDARWPSNFEVALELVEGNLGAKHPLVAQG